MTDKDTKKVEMARLQQEIEYHNKCYYIDANPKINDRDYDMLLKRLEALEEEFPEFAAATSPTRRVGGAPLDGFVNVAHAQPMKSLSNTYNKDDLTDFDERIRRILPEANFTYILEPKIDGVAISIRYENGELVQALTRGDGVTGDDVTANIKTIPSIPLRLQLAPPPALLEVRGEIYMDKQGFAVLNEQRQEEGLEPFANPRNACAGSLKQLDPKQVAKRPLDAIFYATGALEDISLDTHEQMLQKLSEAGLKTAPKIWVVSAIDEVTSLLDQLYSLRNSFPFDMDGAVIKVNERAFYDSLGSTAKSPRWAVAYKYQPEQAQTLLKAITIQVGRTGVLTPVAELEPVQLSGTSVQRATLHNAEEIERKDVREGDYVIVEKAGEIIPAIVRVVTEKRRGNEVPFSMPTHCPICSSEVEQRTGEIAIRCPNLQCPAQLKTWLEHFVSRDALDIEGLGGIVCDRLIEAKLVQTPLDLFSLQESQLSTFNLGTEDSPRILGSKNGTKIIDSLKHAKQKPLANWLFALGIPKLGKIGAQIIARAHTSLEDVAQSNILQDIVKLNDGAAHAKAIKKSDPDAYQKQCDELEEIGDRIVDLGWYKKTKSSSKTRTLAKYTLHNNLGVGNKTADSVLQYMSSLRGQEILQQIKQHQITPTIEKVASQVLKNKSFVITGTLPSLKRPEAAKLISQNGGKVSSSISSNTDYLLAGEKAGSKLTKAQSLGVQVISETDLQNMIS